MKKILIVLIVVLSVSGLLYGKNYTLNDSEDVNLSGVDEIVFDLGSLRCSLCFNSVELVTYLKGNGRGNSLDLSLSGSISSNKRDAIPSLTLDKKGSTLTVQIYEQDKVFFGLSQKGDAVFEAQIPGNFDGIVRTVAGSMNLSVEDLSADILDVQSSSGNVSMYDVDADSVVASVSSGNLAVTNIVAESRIDLSASSGNIDLDNLKSEIISVDSSSGRINFTEIGAAEELIVEASSGNITGEFCFSPRLSIHASSGRIDVDLIQTNEGVLDVSSGNIELDTAEAEYLSIKLGSGDLSIARLNTRETKIKTSSKVEIESMRGGLTLEGSSGKVFVEFSELTAPADIDLNSGDITIVLPRDSSFDLMMETSSGDLNTQFDVIGSVSKDEEMMEGTVNNGGPLLDLNTSSGNITIRRK